MKDRPEINIRCESGDLLTLFLDSEGFVVLQVPSPRRGVPRAVLTPAEAEELLRALSDLLARQ